MLSVFAYIFINNIDISTRVELVGVAPVCSLPGQPDGTVGADQIWRNLNLCTLSL